jgi:hypothetical protein
VKIYLRITKVRKKLIPCIRFRTNPEDYWPIISEWAKAAFLLNFGKNQDFYQMECGQNLPNQLPPALAGGIRISTNSFSGFSQHSLPEPLESLLLETKQKNGKLQKSFPFCSFEIIRINYPKFSSI